MYFLTEGIVRVMLKSLDNPNKRPYAVFLNKGSYFGEIALIADAKRTSDVIATDFCITETFSKNDFILLKREFPEVNIRLR